MILDPPINQHLSDIPQHIFCIFRLKKKLLTLWVIVWINNGDWRSNVNLPKLIYDCEVDRVQSAQRDIFLPQKWYSPVSLLSTHG